MLNPSRQLRNLAEGGDGFFGDQASAVGGDVEEEVGVALIAEPEQVGGLN